MSRVRLTDVAQLHAAGYRIERYPDALGNPGTGPRFGWALKDPDGAYLMVGDYGHESPTQWEAVAEGLRRVALDH